MWRSVPRICKRFHCWREWLQIVTVDAVRGKKNEGPANDQHGSSRVYQSSRRSMIFCCSPIYGLLRSATVYTINEIVYIKRSSACAAMLATDRIRVLSMCLYSKLLSSRKNTISSSTSVLSPLTPQNHPVFGNSDVSLVTPILARLRQLWGAIPSPDPVCAEALF